MRPCVTAFATAVLAASAAVWTASCADGTTGAQARAVSRGHDARPPSPPPAAAPAPEIELVESAPLETPLDHPDVRNAADVWRAMVERAVRTLDFSEFYASDAEGDAAKASHLTPVILAIEHAAQRGVRVRFLADVVFGRKYPATLERLSSAGVAVKTIDCGPRYGGVQHAKYFVVDGDEVFVGSQNFDWRSLDHIQEIGVRVRSTAIAGSLSDVFETDWTLADATAPSTLRVRTHASTLPEARTATGESVGLYADPCGWLSDESRWDLDRLVGLLDSARTSLSIQVLTYSTHGRDETTFSTLDDAIHRAAARGVHVRLLVSHWGAKAGSAARRSIDALSHIANIEVRVLTIPPWSRGPIEFARVAHAKYLVVDGRVAWIGTSNWEGDYFLKSRNVAIVSEGGALAPRLARIFEDGWSSPYSAAIF
jgi:phosphatidylserine/phosphatidylglycerophosphate/cardiolipin synthase-like enzyme